MSSSRLGPIWLATALLCGCQAREQPLTEAVSRALDSPALPRPIALWTFEEGSGSTSTDVQGGRVGTLFNGAAFTPGGRVGGGLLLDGLNDHFTVPSPTLPVTNAVTVAAWVKPAFPFAPDSDGMGIIAGRERGYDLTLITGGHIRASVDVGSPSVERATGSTGPSFFDGRFHHIALTSDGTALKIWVDGVEQASLAGVGTPIDSSGDLSVGARTWLGDQHFTGVIDDVRIYDRALSAFEISVLAGSLTITPNAPSFGVVPSGGSSAAIVFFVRNEGDVPTGLLTTTLSGPDAAQFEVVSGSNSCPDAGLAPGAGCTLSVRFLPTSLGSKTAQLRLTGIAGGTALASLIGGVNLTAVLSVSPGSWTFPDTAPFTVSAPVSFLVTNTGTVSSGMIDMAVVGSLGPEFGILPHGCSFLNPGDTCTVPVTFNPISLGHKVGALQLSSGGTVLGTAALEGTGHLDLPVGAPCLVNEHCASDSCVDGVCCGSACGGGDPNDCQACSVSAGAPSDGTCAPVSAGFSCRPAAGVCDAAEVCDGSSLACPPVDAKQPGGLECQAATDLCDVAETCDGLTNGCPADLPAPAGTPCRPSAGACDVADTCNGSDKACIDLKEPSTTVCRAAAGDCDQQERCDGLANTCPAMDLKRPLNAVCRPAAGPCDLVERCDGTDDCPTNTFADDHTICFVGNLPCEGITSCAGGVAACTPPPPPNSCPSALSSVRFVGERFLRIKPAGSAELRAGSDPTRQNPDDKQDVTGSSTDRVGDPSPYAGSYGGVHSFSDPTGGDAVVTSQVEEPAASDIGAEVGRLRAIVSASATGTAANYVAAGTDADGEPSGTYGRARAKLDWSDRITITGCADPADCRLLLLVELSNTYDNIQGLPVASASAFASATRVDEDMMPTEDMTVASVGNNITIRENRGAPSQVMTVSEGEVLDIKGNLGVNAEAILTSSNVSVRVDAGSTAFVRLIPLSPGLTYTTASGRGPYLPDHTPPVAALSAPAQGTVVRGTIGVTASATDDLTGVSRIAVTANGVRVGGCARAELCPVAVDTTAFPDGPLELVVSAEDYDGNPAVPVRRQLVVDNTLPVLTVPAAISATATSAGGAVVTYPASALDGLDGALVPTCTPPSGSLFPPGTTPVVCTATDAAGNSATLGFPVTVTFSWSGVLPPVNSDGSSVFKLGRTVPVKFQLTGDSAPIADLAAFLYVSKLSGAVTGSEIEAISTAAADNGNRFRHDGGQYTFNLSTDRLSVGTWQLRVDLGDGVLRLVNFSLR